MCGIVGYVGPRDAVSIILNGLKRLEYRGYDSAGVAVINGNQIEVRITRFAPQMRPGISSHSSKFQS